MSTYETVRLTNTILTLHHVEDLTQTEIAQRLGFQQPLRFAFRQPFQPGGWKPAHGPHQTLFG